ncbi:MAG: ABC transporter substrate-binding protein [Chitinophagaceae bacterium]|nr:ABC transporter substrate-binding protein [Chitinophagaceae bacterium]
MALKSIPVSAFLWLFICITGTAQLHRVTLQLKWWHQFQFAGYYAAQKQGYYKQSGLDVQLIPGDAGHDVMKQVLSGTADFGITDSELLLEYSQGQPVVALGAIFQHSPYVIMSLARSGINSPSDLVGKKIMAADNQGWVEMKAVFLKEGINTDGIHVVRHTWNNLDLVRDSVDAMTAYRSVEPYQLTQLGATVSLIEPVTYGIDFYGDILFSRRDVVNKQPELTESFRQASFRGWEYAMAHKEEICDYILNLPGVKQRKVTKQALLFEANEMEKLILPQIIEVGHMNEGRWEHIQSIYHGLGLIPKPTDLKGFVYAKKPSLAESLKNIGIVVLASVASLFLVVLVYGLVVRGAVRRKTKEQRLALEALKESEAELSNTNKELKQFSYITSHNLRAPVTNLLALTQLIDLDKISDEETRSLVRSFATSTTALNETLEDLIRILIIKENAQVPLEKISFAKVLQKVTASIHSMLQNAHATISSDFSECPELVYNASYLESIFMNLLTNSVKYAFPGRDPEITIVTRLVGEETYLVYTDNGLGFDKTKIGDRLFGLHQRFHHHPDSRGIGLYLIHSQITSVGGTIEVESEPGKGTRFTICLKKKI